METKTMLIVLMLVNISFCSSVSGQNTYYWSGKKKIQLDVDSSRLILHSKVSADILNLKANISTLNEVIESNEMPIGSRFAIDIGLDKTKANLTVYRKIAEISQTDFIFPLYRNGSSDLYFTNEIILQPKVGISIGTIIKLVDDGVIIKEKTKYNTFLLEVMKTDNLFRFANLIYESGLVEWCHPNFKADIIKALIPIDPLFSEQYYLNNTGQFGGTADLDINAPKAWDITLGCAIIRVAVIDDGVEDHEDLAGRVLTGFTPQNMGNGAPATPGEGHGEACAGIIAASHNNLGISGLAPNAQIIPVNIFAAGTTNDQIAAGINWAWDPNGGNADILSNSWNFSQTAEVADVITQAITNARTQGRTRGGVTLGCVVVFSSGNFNQSFSGIAYPANVDGVITVGAISNNGGLWNFSSRGGEMDLVAPTGNANLNGDVRTLDRMGGNGFETGNYTSRFGATSAACPQVAGVAALMLSANPNLTEVQVRTILQQTATDMGNTGFDNNFGFGRVDAYQAILLSIVGSINGSGLVCTGTQYQYTYQNLPTGVTLSWSSSNFNGLSINSTSGVATGVSTFSGPVDVLAILTSVGGCTTAVPGSIWVGTPQADINALIYPSNQRGVDPVTLLPDFVYTINSDFVPGASWFTWVLPDGFSFINNESTSYPGIRTSAIEGTYTLYCSANNTCGSSWTQSLGIIISNICTICPRIAQDDKPSADTNTTFAKIAVYPNPANTEFKVRLRAPVEQEGELSLIDLSGNIKRHGIIQKGTQWITLGTSDLFPGMYVIKINDGSKVYYRKVLVQH